MKLTQFPIQTETGLTWSSREDYLSINLGKWNKQYSDIFTRRKLIDMLSMVEGNFKCSPQEEESVQSVWREMQEDIELAKNPPCEVVEVETAVEPAQAPVEVTENAKETDAEIAIVEAACQPINLGAGLGQLLQKFSMGEKLTQCLPNEGTTDAEIGMGITVLCGVKNWTELGLGDLINELEKRGHKNVVPQVISFLGLEESYSTLSAYARTARTIPNDLRELPGIHYSHLQEVATSRFSKDATEQATAIREVLTQASEGRLNVSQTREAVLNRKGKSTTPTPPPEVKKHGRYIVIVHGNCPMSYSTDNLPDADESCYIVDTAEGSLACTGCSLGIPVWQGLPYRKLEQTALTPEVEGV